MMPTIPVWLDGTLLGALMVGAAWLMFWWFKAQQRKSEAEGTINDQAAKAVSTVDGLLEDARAENHLLRAQNSELSKRLGESQAAFATFAIQHSQKLQDDINGMRSAFSREVNQMREEHAECRAELTAMRMAMSRAGIQIPAQPRPS